MPEITQLLDAAATGDERAAAQILGIATRTADAWWAYARAWLAADLSRG
jgi:hypothetical protein